LLHIAALVCCFCFIFFPGKTLKRSRACDGAAAATGCVCLKNRTENRSLSGRGPLGWENEFIDRKILQGPSSSKTTKLRKKIK
jgi:hypothetical protein